MEIGDTVVVRHQEKDYLYTIFDKTSDRYEIEGYTLICKDNVWKIKDAVLEHTISFRKAMTLTGISEIDWMILLHLDYLSLEKVSLVDKHLNEICMAKDFWKEKLFRSYGEYQTNTYRKLYRAAVLPQLSTGGVDEILFLDKKGFLSQTITDRAAINGKNSSLTYLLPKRLRPSDAALELMVKNGHDMCSKWSAKNYQEKRRILVTYFCQYGKHELLIWFYKEHLEIALALSEYSLVNIAAMHGHMAIVEYFMKNFHTSPTSDAANYACEHGDLDTLEKLAAINVLPTHQTGPNRAIGNGHIHLMDWLRYKKLVPDHRGAALACLNGKLEALIWLKERGICPSIYGANLAAQKGHMHILEWLEVLPNSDGADWAALDGHINVLEYLKTRNVKISSYGVKKVLEKQQMDTIRWLVLNQVL